MPRNADPKHGRWILPLIIVAMIVLTVTFVTNLEPATDEASPTTATTTTLAPTTTTLPLDVAAFMVTLETYETQVNAYLGDISNINSDWEGRQSSGMTQEDARAQFEEVRNNILIWENAVGGADVPDYPSLAQAYNELITEVAALAPAVEDIIAGLEAPDDGSLRREAVIDFENQVDAVLDAIANLRTLALQTGTPNQGSTTSTPSGGEEPTTSVTTTTSATDTTVPGTNA